MIKLEDTLFQTLLPFFALAAISIAAFFLKTFLWKIISKGLKNSPRPWAAYFLRHMKVPTQFFILLAILGTGLPFLPHEVLDNLWFIIGIKLTVILFFVLFTDYSFLAGLDFANARHSLSRSTRSLLILVARAVFYSLVALMVLDLLGFSITPLLASLGVGSIAVALALKDTFENFFSGIYLLIDRPVNIGDYVNIDGNIEGFVIKIGWRSTHIRKMENNVVIIPNTKVSNSVIINFFSMEKEMSVPVEVGVAYGTDLRAVEKVTLDAATEVQKNFLGAVPTFMPLVRFHTFGDSSINFTVVLRAKEVTDQFPLKSEFIKILHEHYNREGIEIPFPQRTVHLHATEKVRLDSGHPNV